MSLDDGRLEILALTDPEHLEAHRHEWERLVEATPGTTPVLRPAYAMAGWASRASEADTLLVLLARWDGRLVAVWPLFVAKEGRLRIVRVLGCGGRDEYGDPLIARDCPRPDLVAAALYRRATAAGDLLEAYNLSQASPLIGVLKTDRRPKHNGFMTSPVIDLAKAGSWETWAAPKTKTFRHSLRYDRKHLAMEGAVTFREIAADEAEGFVDWMFATKRGWLDGRGIGKNWLRAPKGPAFYKLILGREGTGVLGFALELDGRPIAGGICLLSTSVLEYYVSAMDPAFYRYSPGNLIIEDMVRWCLARGLDFDFRLTADTYKLRWSDRSVLYPYCDVACTSRGIPTVVAKQVVAWWADWKGRIRRSLGLPNLRQIRKFFRRRT